MKADNEINWTADFEAGAAEDVHYRADGSIGFSIPAERGGDEYLWFFFKVQQRLEVGAEFILENAAGAHQTGERWSITRPMFSADGKNWIRAMKTAYSKEPGISHLLEKPVFRFASPIAADTLWIAYFQPYTNADLQEFLNESSDYSGVEIASAGLSEENRQIPLVRIKPNKEVTAQEIQKIWIVAREHPGETPCSFVCEGMIQAILNDPCGKKLRDSYEFCIIPILNIDGVFHGYYYHSSTGVNLARDWQDFRSVETRILRDAVAADVNEKDLRLMVNLHSSNDPSRGHFFLKLSEELLKKQDADFQQNFFNAADGNHPQLQGKRPVKLLDIPGITGNALYRNYGIYCLYLESNYSRGADGSAVTVESLRETGAALVKTLAEILVPE